MPSIETEVLDPKRDTRGRKVWTEEERDNWLRAYEGSGLTQREFAQRERISYGTFVAWLGRRRREKPGAVDKRRVFHELSLPGAISVGLEVRLSDGTVIRGGNASQMAEMVRALRT